MEIEQKGKNEKNMEKNLTKGFIAILEKGCEAQIPAFMEIKGVLSEDEYEKCFHILKDSGYITFSEGYGYYTSLSGRAYLYGKKAPRKAWLKKHSLGFIAGVVTTSLATVIGTLVNNLIS